MAKHYLKATYYGIMSRCYNPNSPTYKYYGGRGIKVAPEWEDNPVGFMKWVLDHLGERPAGHSLDRINNNGNYEPGNIRWATWGEQANNKSNSRRTRYVLYKGKIIRQIDFARLMGVSRQYLYEIRVGKARNQYPIEFL